MTSFPSPDRDRAQAQDWLNAFFGAIDRMDAAAFAARFDPVEGSFRFGNESPLVGRDAIAGGAGYIFGLLKDIRHDVARFWIAEDHILAEGDVHYLRASDDLALSVPFFSVFELRGERVGSYRVYVDSHALFDPPVEAASNDC